MMKLVSGIMGTILAFACACGGTQVKQKSSDDSDLFKESGDTDMAAEPEKELKPHIVTKEQRKGLCCAACDKAIANDRTGDSPDKIPCADFTAELGEECLKYFSDNPIMASEAKACAVAPAEPEAAGGTDAPN